TARSTLSLHDALPISPPRLPPTPVGHQTETRPRGCPAPPCAGGCTCATTPVCSRSVACPPTEATPTTPPSTPTAGPPSTPTLPRSEEHTSELQSRENL